MAEAAQDVDKVIIDCLAYFTKKARGGGANINKRKTTFDALNIVNIEK